MEHFRSLPDSGIDRKKLHKLLDIIFITIAAVICGANDWENIEEYGQLNYAWLKTVLEPPNGTPSRQKKELAVSQIRQSEYVKRKNAKVYKY